MPKPESFPPFPGRRNEATSKRMDSSTRSDYRAIFTTLDGSDPVAPAAEELQRWMATNRKFNAEVDHDFAMVDGGTRFEIAYAQGDSYRAFKATLEERSDHGLWTTELTAEPSGWVSVAVTNSEGNFVAVPNLAKNLLRRLPLGDAKRPLVSVPTVCGRDGMEDILTLLFDPTRTAAVFVAGIGDEDGLARPFTDHAFKWFEQTYGLAHSFIVTREARAELERRLGAHAVTPWSVRTYLPGLVVGDHLDARRHRFLMPATLDRRRPDAVARLLGGIARGQTHTRTLPPEVRYAERAAARAANRRLTDSLEAATGLRRRHDAASTLPLRPAPPQEIERHQQPHEVPRQAGRNRDLVAASRELALVRDYLGLEEITEAALTEVMASLTAPTISEQESEDLARRLNQLQDEVERRRDEVELLEALLEVQELEAGAGDDEASRLRNEVQWLRGQLRAAGQYEAAASQPEPVRVPADMSELTSPHFLPEGIVFTGDPKFVDEVVDCDDGRCARVAWDAVLAMSDYLRALREGVVSGSFHHYVLHTPNEFRTFAPAKSAENETGITQRQYGDERVFQVPEDVSVSGRARMNAHIKLGRIGLVSPRMHYLHHPETNRIFIGYIGLHLTNTQTN